MRQLILLGLALTLFFSCKKNEDTNSRNDLKQDLNYFPLEIGNYWIYDHIDIDSLGNEIASNRTDSVIIKRDTTINNIQYFILEGTNYPYNEKWGIIDLLKDSIGYLVTRNGTVIFSEDNFSDILASKIEVANNDTLFTLTYQMEKPTKQITVPAGEFETLNYKGTVITHVNIPGIKNPRYINNYYTKGVGKILETYFYLHSSKISEKRLVRFKVGKNE